MKNPNNLVSTRKRLLFMIIAVTFLFISLFVRLAYIQLYQGSDLQVLATDQWYRDLPLNAPRGIIYDTEGSVLVDNKDVYTIYVRPSAVTDKVTTAALLASGLSLDYEDVLSDISKSVSEVALARAVETSVVDELKTLDMSGVYFTPDYVRSYPYEDSLAQVLGYTNIDLEGQSGLELYYDQYLTGIDGFAYTSTDLVGRETESTVTSYVPAIQGCSLSLSIDANIQQFCDYECKVALEDYGAQSTTMIVMDVTDGGIVAMSKTPSFDLNDPPRDDIDLLNELTKNTMITDVYEPGSTFKILTTAAALEQGVVDDDDHFFCNGSCSVDGQKIKCWRTIGHGSQTLAEGVMNSCNCVFMNLALSMGVENFYSSLYDFGLGSKTGVDFYGESSGIMMDEDSVKNVDLARIGFGQAIAVTPLQLITAVSAVINGGTLFQPYFLSSVSDYSGNEIYSHKAVNKGQVISSETSEKMRELLENVVSLGSGKLAAVDGYAIGGKTGTAQKYENGVIAQGKYISSFIGFAPVDDPKYAILMLVDEPSGGVYYGSIVAAPHVGNVFEKIFDYKQIPPTEIVTEEETFEMPNLIGMSATGAGKVLSALGIYYEIAGESGVVESTMPIAGTIITSSEIVLMRMTE